MTLDFTESGRVVVKMTNYVKNMLNDAPASMDGHAATPAATHLFKINMENQKLLGKEKKELFGGGPTPGQSSHSYAVI